MFYPIISKVQYLDFQNMIFTDLVGQKMVEQGERSCVHYEKLGHMYMKYEKNIWTYFCFQDPIDFNIVEPDKESNGIDYSDLVIVEHAGIINVALK